jgi:hypothetical protein
MTPMSEIDEIVEETINNLYAAMDDDATFRPVIREALQKHRKAVREECANVAENGVFLHDGAPEARFAKACAEAIRRMNAIERPEAS